MRCLFGFICVLALGVIGCSETAGTGGSSGVGGDGGSAGMGGGGAGGFGGAGETATLQVLPMELDEDGEQVRLAGVRICEVDTNNCGVSDGLVPVELLVPANREISFTQEREGYDPLLRSDVMPPGLTIVVPVMTPAAPVAEQFEGLMSPYPMEGTGAVFLIVWGGAAGDPIRGATVELVDGTGKRFYIDGEGTWSADLTATTVRGVGGFLEVAPGEAQVRIGGAATDCEVFRGWPGDEENTIRMAVQEGFTTSARVLCTDSN
ncbi:MAG: hypothetical protein WBM48_10235 [Polyangiales bacterium]